LPKLPVSFLPLLHDFSSSKMHPLYAQVHNSLHASAM
jgi:hypothetical protein